MSEAEAKRKIAELVGKYEQVKKSGQIKKYSEEDTKKGFIVPLFQALGWNFEDRDEVSSEEHVKSSGFIDYGFYIRGSAKFFLEAKRLGADIKRTDYANQAIRYSFNRVVAWAVLTDFETLKVFNAQAISKYLGDKQYFSINYDEYLEKFDKLWLLSNEAFQEDLMDKEAEADGKKLQKVSVTDTLFKDLNESRRILTKALHEWNAEVSREDLDEGIQKLLDRLVFLRVAEDRKIEGPILRQLIRDWKNSKDNKTTIYQTMAKEFRELDEIYNSNLFAKHPFEKWKEHSDSTEKVIDILYGNPGYYDYDFKYIPADILGNVYENYLGYQLAQSEKGMEVNKDARKRKEQGIYYTPTYIVDYIVTNALKPVLDKCESWQDLNDIKVLDPACGSGSFLIRALEMIYQKHKEFKNPGADFLIKTSILLNNIYGVDLDEKAIDFAQLNLLIAALDTRMKLPPLDKNIKNGNSLISGTDAELEEAFGKNYRDKKPFNWQQEFPQVFERENPGFDVIIGNPPWGAVIDAEREWLEKMYPRSSKAHKDTYKAFVDMALSILSSKGTMGFIVPSAFLYQPKDQDLRLLITEYGYHVINLGEKIFQGVEAPCSILIIRKASAGAPKVFDFSRYDRGSLQNKLSGEKIEESSSLRTESRLLEKYELKLDDVFFVKDAGIQYHRSGIGLANKGGNDLYKRVFDKTGVGFKKSQPTWYGKLINRYKIAIETDEAFNLDYKTVLKSNESVSFSKDAFEVPIKILWRQTASGILGIIDEQNRWFRNTIQCAYLKPDYVGKVDMLYALGILNSKLLDFLYKSIVLEAGRVFPQVKITYLKRLPFVIGSKEEQAHLGEKVKKIIVLYKEFEAEVENSDKWHSIKSEIEKTDHLIDQLVYKLYNLTPEEIQIVEGENNAL